MGLSMTEWQDAIAGSVILFGSGISIWEPANLPNGQAVSSGLLELLIGEATLQEYREAGLDRFLNTIPFETINDSFHNDLSCLYSNLLSCTRPNALHEELARCVRDGILFHLAVKVSL